MACCILAALILAQIVTLRRRLRAWWFGEAVDCSATSDAVSGWRLSDALPARPRKRTVLATSWRSSVAIALGFGLTSYFVTAHAAHLASLVSGRGDSIASMVASARCTGSRPNPYKLQE